MTITTGKTLSKMELCFSLTPVGINHFSFIPGHLAQSLLTILELNYKKLFKNWYEKLGIATN